MPSFQRIAEWWSRCRTGLWKTVRGLEAITVLKIVRAIENESVILTLIGRIAEENLEELKRVIGLEATDHNLVLDLKDVTLVDQSAIRFLARCEAESVMLENSPAYIRDWIAAEKNRKRGRKPGGRGYDDEEIIGEVDRGKSDRIL